MIRMIKKMLVKTIFTALMAILGLNGCTKDKGMEADDYIKDFSEPQVRELITALGKNKEKEVIRLAQAGVDLNAVGKFENTPLAVAIKIDNLNMVKLLLKLGADPNFVSPKNIAAAEYATSHNNPEYLKALLQYGLDPNLKSYDCPLIFFAIERNLWPQYEMLVAHGADVLTTKSGNNSTVALYMAMQFEYDRLKELIEKGADVETPSNTGLTVIKDVAKMQKRFSGNPEHPAYKARVEILEMLRAKGMKIPPDIPGVRYDKNID